MSNKIKGWLMLSPVIILFFSIIYQDGLIGLFLIAMGAFIANLAIKGSDLLKNRND